MRLRPAALRDQVQRRVPEQGEEETIHDPRGERLARSIEAFAPTAAERLRNSDPGGRRSITGGKSNRFSHPGGRRIEIDDVPARTDVDRERHAYPLTGDRKLEGDLHRRLCRKA